jgi:type VI secretion system protein ImpE
VTAREALSEGRLATAIEIQTQVVHDTPTDPAARLFLFELLVLHGKIENAREHLSLIPFVNPTWPAVLRSFRQLLRAQLRRASTLKRPRFLLPPPAHVQRRWNAVLASQRANRQRAIFWLDRADASAPEIRGFVDGREFIGLRDSDDRFATVWELFHRGHYVWMPFEQIRSLTLQAADAVLHMGFRPARVRLIDHREYEVIVPLCYPRSHEKGDEFALGELVDWTSADSGLVYGFGAKVLTFGEEEIPLAECRMIEIR